MAQVPRLMQDTQTLDDTGGRLQAVDTADAHGASVGRALERFGAVSGDVVTRLYEADAQRDIDEGDAEYQRRSREVLFGRQADPADPDDEGRVGYLAMEGNDATANRARIEQELRDIRADIAQRRRSSGASEAFEEVSGRRLETQLTDADRHILTQNRILQDQAREALAQEHSNSAISNYLDEIAAAADINAGIDIVLEQADADGASDVRTEAMIRDYQSRTWASVIIRRADQDPDGAARLFEARRGLMNAEDAARTMEATRGVFLAQRARTTVDQLLTQTEGDYSAALRLAEDIDNTTERDEVIQRIMSQGAARETAEARVADDAEERARTAIARGGLDAVSAADRSILTREGRWSALVGSGDGDAAQRRFVENQRHMLLGIAMDDPRRFHIIADAMRGVAMPGVTEEDIIEASGGLGSAQLIEMRVRMNGVDAEQWNLVRQRQQEMRGERPVNGSNNDSIERFYERLRVFGEPVAAQRGIYVGSPSFAQSITGQGERQQMRSGEWRAFLLAEARRFVEANQGREPTQADMDAIINRALLRGNNNTYAFEARMGSGGQRQGFMGSGINAGGATRVEIPFARIPPADQRALARQWREANPDVDVQAGSREERAMEAWIAERYADNLQGY